MLGTALKIIRLLYGDTIQKLSYKTNYFINTSEISLIERNKLIPTGHQLEKYKCIYNLTGINEVLNKYKFSNKPTKTTNDIKEVVNIVSMLLNYEDTANNSIIIKETKLKIKLR